jgi:hypothetical protein
MVIMGNTTYLHKTHNGNSTFQLYFLSSTAMDQIRHIYNSALYTLVAVSFFLMMLCPDNSHLTESWSLT